MIERHTIESRPKASLQEYWQKLEQGQNCWNYYCSTCGGKANKAKFFLESKSKDAIFDDLKDISLFGLTAKDFKKTYADSSYFPKERNVSEKIEFLLHAFNYLGVGLKQSLVEKWAHSEIPLWLFDGISFYFIPESPCKEIWLELIRKRLSEAPDASLEETMLLKYTNHRY